MNGKCREPVTHAFSSLFAVTGNLFWTEVIGQGLKDKGYVAVSKNDGRYKRWIVTSGLEEPTAIAVDPQHGMVFWADAGNRPKIESSWMDGSRRRAIVTNRYVLGSFLMLCCLQNIQSAFCICMRNTGADILSHFILLRTCRVQTADNPKQCAFYP